MRKITIHIGLHKTGTSYLQALLVKNRETLADAGLVVPPATHKDSHEQFALALRDGGAQAFLDAVDWGLGESQVISSERVGSLICSPRLALAGPLAQLCARQNIDVKVVILLRRQDILKESVFSEVVKTWYQGTIEDESHYDYDFNRRLQYLERHFGLQNVCVGIYRRRGPQPLARLFMNLLGIDDARVPLLEVEQKNVRMNRRKTMFLSQVPKDSARLVAMVRRVVERNDFILDDGHKNLMSPAQHETFLSRYTQGNDAFMSRYGLSDETWECPDFGNDAGWQPPEPIQAAEYMAVMMAATGHALQYSEHQPPKSGAAGPAGADREDRGQSK